VALSNWHVWADGGAEGDQIIQPGHPTGADHVEAITKVAACGPLLTSLIEWEAPSPLTAGLYGGAAAAAIAAAASDYRDPTRRGQDATAVDPGERTLRETVDMAVQYADLPVPGRPFRTKVKWAYQRETEARVLHHAVEEERVNTQFLLGKMVTVDRAAYQPGDAVRLVAAIWDYQPRPCDAYHVVAHLIPRNRPGGVIRVAMQPTTCPRAVPPFPPRDSEESDPPRETCIDFADRDVGQYPYKGRFDWLSYATADQVPALIQDWFEGHHALVIPAGGIVVEHAPASKVTARVAQFTNEPVTLTAYGPGGQEVGQVTAPAQQATVHELTVAGPGILGARFTGGGGEGLILGYCVETIQEEPLVAEVSESLRSGIAAEHPRLKLGKKRRLEARRCCFTGTCSIPPNEEAGGWDVHLTVQNVNTVPDGTEPEEAAIEIGGHVLSAHTFVEACVAIMLADHVFDVI
jgi:hypothetical protein